LLKSHTAILALPVWCPPNYGGFFIGFGSLNEGKIQEIACSAISFISFKESSFSSTGGNLLDKSAFVENASTGIFDKWEQETTLKNSSYKSKSG